jgi:hypothetical protein
LHHCDFAGYLGLAKPDIRFGIFTQNPSRYPSNLRDIASGIPFLRLSEDYRVVLLPESSHDAERAATTGQFADSRAGTIESPENGKNSRRTNK